MFLLPLTCKVKLIFTIFHSKDNYVDNLKQFLALDEICVKITFEIHEFHSKYMSKMYNTSAEYD